MRFETDGVTDSSGSIPPTGAEWPQDGMARRLMSAPTAVWLLPPPGPMPLGSRSAGTGLGWARVVRAVTALSATRSDMERGERASIDYPASLLVARVRVEHSVKGVVQGTSIHFLAMGSWTCDISTAEVGERALFFLQSSEWTSQLAASTREALQQQASGGSAYKCSKRARRSPCHS